MGLERVETVTHDTGRIVEIISVFKQAHTLGFLLPTRYRHFFPDKEQAIKKTFFRLPIDKVNQDSIAELDHFFFFGNLSKFSQVIDTSVTPWKTVNTHFGKFVICDGFLYFFRQ